MTEIKPIISNLTRQVNRERIEQCINENVNWLNKYYRSDDPEDREFPPLIKLSKEDHEKIIEAVYDSLAEYDFDEIVDEIVRNKVDEY